MDCDEYYLKGSQHHATKDGDVNVLRTLPVVVMVSSGGCELKIREVQPQAIGERLYRMDLHSQPQYSHVTIATSRNHCFPPPFLLIQIRSR